MPAKAPAPVLRTLEARRGCRSADAIARCSLDLANRLGELMSPESKWLVPGGDCSRLLGCALALRRRGDHGLAFIDGCGDFRHPDPSGPIGAAAGEGLAIVTGQGDARLIKPKSRGPLARHELAQVVGVRGADEDIAGRRRAGIQASTARR